MTLWTIQRIPAWQQFQANGILRATAEYVDPFFMAAYAWMREQMAARIGPPPEPDGYPVWAWYRYAGEKKPRPDLRCGGHLCRGVRGVRIEIECAPETVLLSDFSEWHAVLSHRYIAASEAEADAFDDERLIANRVWHNSCASRPDFVARIRASWERIFDLERYVEGLTSELEGRMIQACLWQGRMDQVRDVTPFVSR
jgi:hypothetical protein